MNSFIKQIHRHRKQTFGYHRGKVGGRDKWGIWKSHTHRLLHMKQITNKDRLYSAGSYINIVSWQLQSAGSQSRTRLSNRAELIQENNLKKNMCAQSHLIPGDLMDHRSPGSSFQGIFQARTLEWVAISSSRGSSRPRDWTCISCIPCIGRQIIYHSATSEVLILHLIVARMTRNQKKKTYTYRFSCVRAQSLQSGLTLCDPMNCRLLCLWEFSRQGCWSGLPCSPPGDLPDPGMVPTSLFPALVGSFFTTNATWEAHIYVNLYTWN